MTVLRLRIRPIRFSCCRIFQNSSSRRFASSEVDATPIDTSAINETPTTAVTPARTRFAPSPTGHLHLGSLRTALFNYLWAKKTGGQFILRIEDTDTKRTIEGAETSIIDDLKWAGLQWDEGPEIDGPYGPYRQSERVTHGTQESKGNIYKKHAEMLIESGHAYRCFCSQDDIKTRNYQRKRLATEYDGTCSHISPEESAELAKTKQYSVRWRDDKPGLTWNDIVFGEQGVTKKAQHNNIRNDWVVLKSDGWPTYHLANVVDDFHMKITHVIRGSEWLKSTPKHLALYEAFGWDQPKFGHVGLLRDTSLGKLSKRAQTFDLKDIKSSILPEALTNFLVLLGWKQKRGDGKQSEVFTMEEMIESFDLDLKPTNPIVTLDKLHYLQRKHLLPAMQMQGPEFEKRLVAVLENVQQRFTKEELTAVGIGDKDTLRKRLHQLLATTDEVASPHDWISARLWLFTDKRPSEAAQIDPENANARKKIHDQLSQDVVHAKIVDHFKADFGTGSAEFSTTNVNQCLDVISRELQESIRRASSNILRTQAAKKQIYQRIYRYLRLTVAWGINGGGIQAGMASLGYEIVMQRLEEAKGRPIPNFDSSVARLPQTKEKQSVEGSTPASDSAEEPLPQTRDEESAEEPVSSSDSAEDVSPQIKDTEEAEKPSQ